NPYRFIANSLVVTVVSIRSARIEQALAPRHPTTALFLGNNSCRADRLREKWGRFDRRGRRAGYFFGGAGFLAAAFLAGGAAGFGSASAKALVHSALRLACCDLRHATSPGSGALAQSWVTSGLQAIGTAKMSAQAGLRLACCCLRQATIAWTSGMYWLHSRWTSGVQAARCLASTSLTKRSSWASAGAAQTKSPAAQ